MPSLLQQLPLSPSTHPSWLGSGRHFLQFCHLQVGIPSPRTRRPPHPQPKPRVLAWQSGPVCSACLWEGHVPLPTALDSLCPQLFIPGNPFLAWNVLPPSFLVCLRSLHYFGFPPSGVSALLCTESGFMCRASEDSQRLCAPLAHIFLAQGWAVAQYQPVPASHPLCALQLAWSRDQGSGCHTCNPVAMCWSLSVEDLPRVAAQRPPLA